MFKKNGRNKASKSTGSSAKGFQSLFSRILIFVGGPVVLAFLAVSFVLLTLVSATVTNLTARELSAKSLAAAHDINNYFQKHFEIVKTLSESTELETLFTDVSPGVKINEYEGFPAIKRTLENVQESNSGTVLSVWVVDVDSSQLAQADGYLSDESWNVQKRPWFIQMSGENTAVLTEPYEDTATKLQIVNVVAPVFRPGTGEIIGAVGVDISLEMLGETIQGYTLGEEGFYILVAGSGHILYHPTPEYVNKNISDTNMSENIQKAVLSKTEGSLEYTSHGTPSHGCVSLIGNTGWMVATGLPTVEFKQDFYAVRAAMLTTFAIAAGIIILILLVISRTIVAPIKMLTKTANLIAEGNLDVSAEVRTRDETGQMANAINRTVVQLRRYIAYIREISATLENMAQGDMRIRLQEDYIGEFASIRSAFTNLSDSLNYTLHTIDTAAEQVSAGSSQVASGAQALASGSTEQAATVQELSAAIERIAEQAAENSVHVLAAAEYIEQAGVGVNSGNEHMKQLTNAMEDIHAASDQIDHITKVIEDIAFQTNILALNAAIEAARAGNAGKGFAVVADEVRSLAAKSAEAAQQTSVLIQKSVTAVATGAEMTAETAQILQDVSVKAAQIIESFDKIQQASAEQTSAIGQIKEGISQVSAVVQTNAATAEENSATSEEMSAQAATLHQEVGKFKLEGERTSTPSAVLYY